MLGPSAGALARVFAPGQMKPKKRLPFGMPQRGSSAMSSGLGGGLGTFSRAKPPIAKTPPPTGVSKIALPGEMRPILQPNPSPITAPGGRGDRAVAPRMNVRGIY